MNILFVYSEIVVEEYNGQLYHNFLGDIINRYSQYGNLTICVTKKEVESPSSKKIEDNKKIKYEFIDKENTIKNAIYRKRNNEKLKELISRIDFVIVHVPCGVQDLVAKWCEKFGKPYMGVVVGCPWDSLTNHSFKGKLLAPLSYLSLRKFMIKVPYAIYVTNRFLQNRYPTNGNNIGCSDVAIPSWISADILDTRQSLIHKNNTTVNLVSVGAVNNPVKGHEDVIKALALLNDKQMEYRYHLIGGGNNSRLKKIARKYNVEDKVIFHGQLPHDRIFSILQTMDIYIQPSRTEGLPRAVVEAMSLGCPTIATSVGGNPELIDKEWLYRPKKISTLVRLIRRLSTKEKMCEISEIVFQKAQNYQKKLLDKKRHDFIMSIIRKSVSD